MEKHQKKLVHNHTKLKNTMMFEEVNVEEIQMNNYLNKNYALKNAS